MLIKPSLFFLPTDENGRWICLSWWLLVDEPVFFGFNFRLFYNKFLNLNDFICRSLNIYFLIVTWVQILLYMLNFPLWEYSTTLLNEFEIHLPIRTEILLSLNDFLNDFGVKILPLSHVSRLLDSSQEKLWHFRFKILSY